MCRYEGIKVSSVRISSHASIKVCSSQALRVLRNAGIQHYMSQAEWPQSKQVLKDVDINVFGCLGMQVSRHTSNKVCRCQSMKVSSIACVQVSRCDGIKASE